MSYFKVNGQFGIYIGANKKSFSQKRSGETLWGNTLFSIAPLSANFHIWWLVRRTLVLKRVFLNLDRILE